MAVETQLICLAKNMMTRHVRKMSIAAQGLVAKWIALQGLSSLHRRGESHVPAQKLGVLAVFLAQAGVVRES